MTEEPIEIPIDGSLDLHTFIPKEIKSLVPEYLHECMNHNIFKVKLIHGKGSGILRHSIHALLSKLSYVQSFRLGHAHEGGWGVTIVQLIPNALL